MIGRAARLFAVLTIVCAILGVVASLIGNDQTTFHLGGMATGFFISAVLLWLADPDSPPPSPPFL